MDVFTQHLFALIFDSGEYRACLDTQGFQYTALSMTLLQLTLLLRDE